MFEFICVCMCVQYVYVCVHVDVFMCACGYVYVCTVHVCMWVCICVYSTCVYVGMCVCVCNMRRQSFLVNPTTTPKTTAPGKKLGEREALRLLSCTLFCLESSGEKEKGC